VSSAFAKLAATTVAWLRVSRALRLAAVLTAVDVCLGWAFSWQSRSRGLFSPGGSIHAGVAVLGALFILTRIAARFGVPALVAGAISAALVKRYDRNRSVPRRVPPDLEP
jgi:hypothetical protein